MCDAVGHIEREDDFSVIILFAKVTKSAFVSGRKHTKSKKQKIIKIFLKKHLTKSKSCDIIYKRFAADTYAGVVQW